MKILAATDGSRPAEKAVRFAIRLARTCRSVSLVVVTVGDLSRNLFAAGETGKTRKRDLDRTEKAARRRTERILERAALEIRKLGGRGHCEYLESRDLETIAETISRKADREGADLIVVGSHGRSALAEWALGSVTRRLARLADRPVTIVRARRRSGGRA